MILIAKLKRSVVLQLIGLLGLPAIAQLLLSGVLAAGESADHARIHATFALVALLLGGGIVVLWSSSGLASRAPAAGFAILAGAQLVESVGAFGFDAANGGERTGLAVVHDLGLGATALGLLVAVAGVSIGDRKSTRLNSSHIQKSRMPSSA